MSEKELRDSKYVENSNPPWIVEQLVHKVRKSVADAFLEHIEYGKDYVIKTKMVEDDWGDGFGTKYTYNLKFEELVRCRDCVWAKPDQSEHEFRELRCNMWIADVSADGFCSRGKRREP